MKDLLNILYVQRVFSLTQKLIEEEKKVSLKRSYIRGRNWCPSVMV